MDFEWIRILTVILATIATIQFWLFWKRTHEYGVIAPVSWLLLVISYSIFKFIVDGDLRFYTITLVWNNLISVYGISLLIVGGILFRDLKSWTYKR